MGLDLSCTATGIVVLGEGRMVTTCTGHTLTRTSPVRDKVERLLGIAGVVVRLAREHAVTHVGIEGYAYSARGAQNDLAELHGVIKSQLWLAMRLEPYIVQPSAARKAVLGAGRVGKEDIVRLVRARGVAIDNHNMADAWVVAEWLRLELAE